MTRDQPQLFDTGGPIRTGRTAKQRSASRHKRHIFERLTGAGRVRRDPVTGKMYEHKGGGNIKRAYEWTCECGNRWWAGTGSHRKQGGLCPSCRQRIAIEKQVEKNSAAIGTKWRSKTGYVYIKTEDGWQFEHRVVLAAYLGRPLRETESAHHINGKRDDNRLENLQLRHRYHGAGQAHQCLDCGSTNVGAVPLMGAGGVST